MGSILLKFCAWPWALTLPDALEMLVLELLRLFLREGNTLGWLWPSLELLLRPGPSVPWVPLGLPTRGTQPWFQKPRTDQAVSSNGDWLSPICSHCLRVMVGAGEVPTILEAVQMVGAQLQPLAQRAPTAPRQFLRHRKPCPGFWKHRDEPDVGLPFQSF